MANGVMASTMSHGDTVKGTCVLCDAELAGSALTFEHVIPESLGGRRRTDKVLCRDCNSRTGHEWDAQLAKQLLPFAQMVFPNGHRSGPKQRRIRDSQGNSLLLKAGIRGGAEHPQSRMRQVGDKYEMTISAPSRQRAVQEIRRLVKEGKLPEGREEEIIQGIQREEIETRIMFSEAGGVGGEAVWNSWLKSMVTAGVLGGLSRQDMLAALESLRGCGPAAPMFPIRNSCIQPSGQVPVPIWRHCVHVESDEAAHVIWGYTEFFGTFNAIAQIGMGYRGQTLKWTYCVDPVTGDDLSGAVQVDLTRAQSVLNEVRTAPERADNIAAQQAPDLRPLVDECLRAQGIEGKVDIVSSWLGTNEPDSEATISEMTWIDRVRD